MVRDAEAYAEGDRKRKELIEARNEADSLAYSTDKSLQEHKVGTMLGSRAGLKLVGRSRSLFCHLIAWSPHFHPHTISPGQAAPGCDG